MSFFGSLDTDEIKGLRLKALKLFLFIFALIRSHLATLCAYVIIKHLQIYS